MSISLHSGGGELSAGGGGGALLPLVEGELLHVDDDVALVDDLVAEDGLDDVLHREEALE